MMVFIARSKLHNRTFPREAMSKAIWLVQLVTVGFGMVQMLMVQSQSDVVPSWHQPQTKWGQTNQNSLQEQQQRAINDVLHSFNNLERQRILQQECNATEGADNPCVLQPPEVFCESYNNRTAGVYTCTCSRYGTSNTQVDCTYVEPQCNTDNSTCFIGSISQIFNTAAQSRAVTACTTFIQSFSETVPLNSELCIRVIPFDDGNYETLSSCSASLQVAGSSEGKACSSCTICEAPDASANTNTSVNPNISFNCCNVMTDIQQTCAPVGAMSGVAIPQYDAIAPENQGTCTSHADRTRNTAIGSSATLLLVWLLLQ